MHTIWIEIPVSDLSRAKTFYEAVFGFEPTQVIDDGVRKITIVPGEPNVSLNQTHGFTPSSDGSLPYFGVGDDLDAALARLSAVGGTVVEPKTPRGELGFFSLVRDPDGNSFYLHGTS